MSEEASAPLLLAELWYVEPPRLDDPDVLAALREISAEAEAQNESIVVPHVGTDRPVDQPPLLTAVLNASPPGSAGKSRPDVSQTWDWAEAEAVVADCRSSVVVSELMAAWSSPHDRVTGLTEVVAALVRCTKPAAISWPQSQRVCDPAGFAAGDLDGVLNVRLFTVANDPGALVMDTLGLHVFGLPDVQCHFRDRDPGEVAAMLFATGVYIFEAGDVIADGNTISEPDGQGRYVCRREPALLEPQRLVLDVDLGDPYAAGERDRAVG